MSATPAAFFRPAALPPAPGYPPGNIRAASTSTEAANGSKDTSAAGKVASGLVGAIIGGAGWNAKARENFIAVVFAKGEAAFAAAELAVFLDHLVAHIPGGVDHDGARIGVGIFGIEPFKPHGAAVFAHIFRIGAIGAGGSRIRPRSV